MGDARFENVVRWVVWLAGCAIAGGAAGVGLMAVWIRWRRA